MLTKNQFTQRVLNILLWPIDLYEAIREIKTAQTTNTATITDIQTDVDEIQAKLAGLPASLTPTFTLLTTGTRNIPAGTKAFTISNEGAAVDCTVGGTALPKGESSMPLGSTTGLVAQVAVVHGATAGNIFITEWN